MVVTRYGCREKSKDEGGRMKDDLNSPLFGLGDDGPLTSVEK
jgi:hypothetical protein